MKIKIVLIAVAVILISIFATGCGKSVYTSDERDFAEWVSPDGVHYWYRTGGYGMSFLAPRYNHDGELVIE